MLRGHDLRLYRLEDHRLPFAPRLPFEKYSVKALEAALALSMAWPEKRGILTSVMRSLVDSRPMTIVSGITIEVHFDATEISIDLANRLLELGFEPDSFVHFVPSHFLAHYTIKFKIESCDVPRRKKLLHEALARAADLVVELESRWPLLEAYIETEVYSDRTRHKWTRNLAFEGSREQLRGALGRLVTVVPPCTDAEAADRKLPLSLRKKADIHVKLARQSSVEKTEELLILLEEIGFYRVFTWAGNNICTAQFEHAKHAIAYYRSLVHLFDAVGGCAELTLEGVMQVWRSTAWETGIKCVAALPPLTRMINRFESQNVGQNVDTCQDLMRDSTLSPTDQ